MGPKSKFFIKIFVGLIVLVLTDVTLASVLQFYHAACPSGDIKEVNYIIKEAEEDILFMGSSRARHHLIPSVFEASFDMDAYNAGMNGKGIFYHYCILSAFVERSIPKILVLDLTENDLIISERFGLEALRVLAPHYNHIPAIDSVLELEGLSKKVKLQSGLYRYNSEISEILSGYLLDYKIEKGYKPLMGSSRMQLEKRPTADFSLDALKLLYLRRFLSLAKSKGIRVFVTISPSYHISDGYGRAFERLKSLCVEYSVPVFDYAQHDFFLSSSSLFKDPRHLNHQGATEYSRRIVQEIDSVLAGRKAE